MFGPAVETFDQPVHKETLAPFKPSFTVPEHAIRLTEAPLECTFWIVRLGSSCALSLKLRALGLADNTALSVLSGHGRGPRVVRCGAARVALSYELASEILVVEEGQ
ncbi:FeoA family protein [Polycladidibacter hongkongensis]|uniref:FeoA family protein n=1 Tax=Polycladidibacter hongkongensis TaxID=1647556 RepID=UPI0008296B02|nr:FeoA family protein [Pseudovibrio hongkongensis]